MSAELFPVRKTHIDLQIACVAREIQLRVAFYPKWVDAGKMTQGQADEEVARMRSVLATLEWVRERRDGFARERAEQSI